MGESTDFFFFPLAGLALFLVELLVVPLPLLPLVLGGLRLLESIELTWRGMEFGKEFWELLSFSIIMLMPLIEWMNAVQYAAGEVNKYSAIVDRCCCCTLLFPLVVQYVCSCRAWLMIPSCLFLRYIIIPCRLHRMPGGCSPLLAAQCSFSGSDQYPCWLARWCCGGGRYR